MVGQGPMGRCYAIFHFRHLRKTVHLYVQFYRACPDTSKKPSRNIYELQRPIDAYGQYKEGVNGKSFETTPGVLFGGRPCVSNYFIS